MNALADFKITRKWPPQNPDIIQLYSLTTPNGVKVSIALEEMGLPYEAHFVSFGSDDQMTPEFLSLNPNNKIPAIVDPNGPGGRPLALFESGAILIYLAEKSGKFLPEDPARRYECLQWLMFQMGGVGPMFGQFGHFYKFAADKVKDPYAKERYRNEAKRLLKVLDQRLDGRDYVMGGDYTIADIAIFPWVRALSATYGAQEVLDLHLFAHVDAYLARCLARPGVAKGLDTPARPG